ncbi:MAG TPA: AsmA family protein [Candidatus Eremiobacteraceae bacterium]|nr:AsmA family protein [Candidatus Eremiobacteraceae bacterium]
MATRRKTGLIIILIAGALVAALLAFAPAFFKIDRYRPQVISYLQEKTGKQIEIGRLALTFFPVSIQIDKFGVKNPPIIFPPGYVLQVSRIDARLSFAALLHRQIVINSLILEDPIVNLTSDPDGPWNFENPHAQASTAAIPMGIISNVQIKNGGLVASNLLPSDAAGPIFFEAHNISGDLQQVNLVGIMNPASTTMDGRGSVLIGVMNFGAVVIKNLSTDVRLEARHSFFTDLKAQIYGGNAAGDCTFDLSGKNAAFKANIQLGGISVSQLLAAFPNGGGKMTGKMEGDVKLAGDIAHTLRPLAGIHGTARIKVRNGKVPSLKLNANLMKLAHFNDLGPAKDDPSSFNLIATDLELNNQRISSRVIDIDGYGVDVDGSGSVSVSGSDDLNYRGLAEITTKEGFFTNTIARFSGASLKNGKLQFPFRITGTIDNPIFAKGKGDKDVDAAQKRVKKM